MHGRFSKSSFLLLINYSSHENIDPAKIIRELVLQVKQNQTDSQERILPNSVAKEQNNIGYAHKPISADSLCIKLKRLDFITDYLKYSPF